MCYALCSSSSSRTNRTWSDCTLSRLSALLSLPLDSPGLWLLIAFAIRECAVNCCYFNAIFKWNANCLMISIGKLLEYLTSAERREPKAIIVVDSPARQETHNNGQQPSQPSCLLPAPCEAGLFSCFVRPRVGID